MEKVLYSEDVFTKRIMVVVALILWGALISFILLLISTFISESIITRVLFTLLGFFLGAKFALKLNRDSPELKKC